jgi:hypothetical protein
MRILQDIIDVFGDELQLNIIGSESVELLLAKLAEK